MKTTVVNLLAGPGAAKSTTAAGLFYKMKVSGYKVELLTEYAKELVYADRTKILAEDQLYVFAKQNHRLANMVGKVDYVITDSSLLFSNIYCDYMPDSFYDLVMHTYYQYNNLNFFIERPTTFQQYGRVQNLEESKAIDTKIKDLLATHLISYSTVPACEYTIDDIYSCVEQHNKSVKP